MTTLPVIEFSEKAYMVYDQPTNPENGDRRLTPRPYPEPALCEIFYNGEWIEMLLIKHCATCSC